MRIRVQLFAGARDRVGKASVDLEIPENATIASLRTSLVATYPHLSDIVPRATIAVDMEYARDNALISPDSEIALIPPVSGG